VGAHVVAQSLLHEAEVGPVEPRHAH
jgi:hypothetical protein